MPYIIDELEHIRLIKEPYRNSRAPGDFKFPYQRRNIDHVTSIG